MFLVPINIDSFDFDPSKIFALVLVPLFFFFSPFFVFSPHRSKFWPI